jgi:hypothetical protein
VHEVKDHSLAAFRAQWPLTRDLLGGHLGRYLVHSATLGTGVLADTDLHRELAMVRELGIRVGIATSGPRQADAIRAALDVEVNGAQLFTSFQVTWNPLEPSVGDAAALAQPWAWRVLSGAATPAHLASHVVAADLVLDPELVAETLAAAQDPHDYWAERSTRPWT